MQELRRVIPDADVLLRLEPEELGGKILFLLRNRYQRHENFHPGNLQNELWMNIPGQECPYPRHRETEINLALSEAWAWLEAQGLIVPTPSNGQYGWRNLSRRAQRFENEADFARYATARLLDRRWLHFRIASTVWMAFMRGEFDVAVFQAMKAVEVAVRDAAGLSDGDIGVTLMRDAFRPQNGPLTDPAAERAERQARSDLFAGAIGSYKNPHSHRDVQLDSPDEAVEIILLANHLLRIVDSRKKCKESKP